MPLIQAPWTIEEDKKDQHHLKHVEADWPCTGAVDFDNYQLHYRPGLDLVIKDLTCHVNGQEKVPLFKLILAIYYKSKLICRSDNNYQSIV